jgi:hypothetical protein
MSSGYDCDELLDLLNRLTAGTIESAEHDRLEEILKSHAGVREHYFAFLDLDMGLREMALSRSAEIPPPVGVPPESPFVLPSQQPRSRVTLRGYAIVAAVTALATGLLLFVYMNQFRGPPDKPLPRRSETVSVAAQPAPEYVATLVFADDCRWGAENGSLVEGGRLAKGELHLLEGLACCDPRS